MKKLFVIILMLMYGFSSSGMTVQFHYCCGKLANIDFKTEAEKKCAGAKKMMGNKPCCETKQFSADKEDDHFTSQVDIKIFRSYAGVPSTVQSFPVWIIVEPAQENLFSPPLFNQRVFLRNCVLRI